ncbi:MAG: sulfite exporter TauE/SafE family protein [Gallionellaceae bacterium]
MKSDRPTQSIEKGYPLRLKPHRLVATDIAHAIPLAFVSGLGYLYAGLVNGQMLISLLAGSIPAVIAGCFLTRLCSARLLQIVMACALLLAGLKMLL